MKYSFIILLFSFLFFSSCQEKTGEYVCTPCDLPCDELTFSKAGTCPHCQMDLVKKSDLEREKELTLNQIDIHEGSGVFLIEGGIGNEEKFIKVFYHKPENFNPESKILLVIPGAGRNGDSYRDAWTEKSEKYGVLVLSPMYAEEDYAFEDYHMCGLMRNLNLEETIERVEGSNVAKLNEDKFTFDLNTNRNEWIFNDFDRIFDLVVEALHSNQIHYDIFGHSAGGQISHRFAIFHPNSKVDRIVASNSGFYTLPDVKTKLPFGIKETPLIATNLQSSFSKKLILFIGELDNETETRGTLLRSKNADKQGVHRLERAKFFYKQAKKIAEDNNFEFNWTLKIVPNVGHNHRGMGQTVSKYLYSNQHINE